MAEQDFWQSILEYCSDVQSAIPRLESVPRNSDLIDISPLSEDLNIVDDIFDTKDILDPSYCLPSLCETPDITDPASCSFSKPLLLQSNAPEWDISNWSSIPGASMANHEIMNPANEFLLEDQKLAGDQSNIAAASHLSSCPPISNVPDEAMEYIFPTCYNLQPAMPETLNAIPVSSAPSLIHDDPSYLNSSWNGINSETAISAPSAHGRAGSNQRGSSDRITDITLNELSQYFNMPITQAAKELKVGLTVLKKRCREFGIPRWPHRKMKSLESLINNIQELGKNNGGLSNARLRNAVQILEEQKKLMEEMPGIELAERTKRLRQACFKASYKKRRQMALESANQLGGSEGSTS